jgi:hypothetical protein
MLPNRAKTVATKTSPSPVPTISRVLDLLMSRLLFGYRLSSQS